MNRNRRFIITLYAILSRVLDVIYFRKLSQVFDYFVHYIRMWVIRIIRISNKQEITSMNIINYTPNLKIANTEQLAKGTGAKYLLVLVNGDILIAHSWKRTAPKSIKPGYALVKFSK